MLGRSCARPDRYAVTFAPRREWRGVDVFGFGLDRGGDGPASRPQLSWTGSSYE